MEYIRQRKWITKVVLVVATLLILLSAFLPLLLPYY